MKKIFKIKVNIDVINYDYVIDTQCYCFCQEEAPEDLEIITKYINDVMTSNNEVIKYEQQGKGEYLISFKKGDVVLVISEITSL